MGTELGKKAIQALYGQWNILSINSKKQLKLWKPTFWGEGTQYVSEKMDDILYSDK
jgi:hypothetical protein